MFLIIVKIKSLEHHFDEFSRSSVYVNDKLYAFM